MPPPRNPRLSALWITDPKEAAYEVKLAMAANGGDVDGAAKDLGVSRKTVYRYLERLRLEPNGEDGLE